MFNRPQHTEFLIPSPTVAAHLGEGAVMEEVAVAISCRRWFRGPTPVPCILRSLRAGRRIELSEALPLVRILLCQQTAQVVQIAPFAMHKNTSFDFTYYVKVIFLQDTKRSLVSELNCCFDSV